MGERPKTLICNSMGKKTKKKAQRGQRVKKSPSNQSPSAQETVVNEKQVGLDDKACKHLEKGINLEKLSAQIAKSEVLHCQGCFKGGDKKQKKRKGKVSKSKDAPFTAIWVCLGCGHLGCGHEESGMSSNGHAWQHWLHAHHPYALKCSESIFGWCFPCKTALQYGSVKQAEGGEEGSNRNLLLQALKVVRGRLLSESLMDAPDVARQGERLEPPTSEKRDDARAGYSVRMVKGLMNLGNTCFFNSVMQNLLALDALREHFMKPTEFPEGPLTSSLRKLYVETSLEGLGQGEAAGLRRGGRENGTINPKALFGAICAKAPQFRGYQQQDSHEMLRCLLDNLHTEELNARKAKNRRFLELQDENKGNGEASQDNTNGDSTHKDSSSNTGVTFVDSVFDGQLSSTVCCCECGHSSVVYEPFLDLSLPIPTKQTGKKASLPRYQTSSPSSSKVQLEKDKKSKKGGCGRGRPSLVPFTSKPQAEAEVPDQSSSCPAVQSNGLTLEEQAGNEPVLLEGFGWRSAEEPASEEDFGWMEYLVTGNDSESSLSQAPFGSSGTVQQAEKLCVGNAVPECNVTLLGSSETDLAKQISDCDSVSQTEGSLYRNSESCPIQTLDTVESNMQAAEGSVHVFGCHDGLLNSGYELQSELGQQDDPLPMVGDSEVLLLPYKSLESANDGDVEMIGNPPGMVLSGTNNSLDKHLDLEGLPTLDPEQSDEGFDGFGQLFEEEETSFVLKKKEGESESFQLYDGNVEEDLLEVEISIPTENNDGINKEEFENTIIPMSVVGCLADFTRPELLAGEDAWECEKCSAKISGVSSEVVPSAVRSEQGMGIQETPTSESTANISVASKIDETQLDLENGGGKTNRELECFTNRRYYGISSSEGDENDSSKVCGGRVMCNGIGGKIMGNAQGLKETKLDWPPDVTMLNHQENGKPADQEGCQMGMEFIGINDITVGRPNNIKSDSLFGQEDLCSQTEGESMLRITGAKSGLKDGIIQAERNASGSLVAEGEGICSNLGRRDFKLKDCNKTVDMLQHKKSRTSGRGHNPGKRKLKKPEHETSAVKQDATKRFLINKAPLVLTIHLKRFSQDLRGRLSKLSGHVTFQDRLDLRPFLDPRCSDKESCIYRLIGVVEHSGTMRGGHYVAYVRGHQDENCKKVTEDGPPENNPWHFISDAHVREASFSEVLQSEAYLLFYEKCIFH